MRRKNTGPLIVTSKRNSKSIIKGWRSQVTNSLTHLQAAKSCRETEKKNIKQLEKSIQSLEEVQQLVQDAAAEVEKKIHKQISTVVSRCLASVFGKDAYDFQIKFEKKRGKTEALLLFFRNGEYVDPLSAAGGGVVDIGSFSLRVTSILSAVPKLRRLVVLDEPFRHLAPELRPIAIQLVKELSEELDVQFIIVSHFSKNDLEELGSCGKVIEV